MLNFIFNNFICDAIHVIKINIPPNLVLSLYFIVKNHHYKTLKNCGLFIFFFKNKYIYCKKALFL